MSMNYFPFSFVAGTPFRALKPFIDAMPPRVIGTCLFFLALLLVSPPAQADQELSYLTEEYYPYNYIEHGEIKGISVDILRLIWQELGQKPCHIQIMPWARGIDRACHISNTVLFSTARTPQRENLFRWAGPIATVRFVLVAKKTSNIVLQDIHEAEGFRIGTLRNDMTDIILQQHNGRNKIEALAAMRQNVQKLMEGRLDMVAYEETSWRKVALRYGLSPDDFETVYVLRETPIYFAFHRDTPLNQLHAFQKALDRIKASPRYQEILDQYLR